MAKNQNTFAKRQREIEQKRKALEKRARREERKRDSSAIAIESNSYLSKGEQSVLGIFHKYMISQGQMFCFNGTDSDNYGDSIRLLIQKGLLLAENSTGRYSLTATGFAEMKKCG
jgi:hypothetical protein